MSVDFAEVIREAAVKRAAREVHAERMAEARRQELWDAVREIKGEQPRVKLAPVPKAKRDRKARRCRKTFDWDPWYPWIRKNRKRLGRSSMAAHIQLHSGHEITIQMISAALQRLKKNPSLGLKVG